jgi:hypothetical protein
MTVLSRISDHVARGLVKVAMPFWGLPRFSVIVTALLTELQELEDALMAIPPGRDLDQADEARLLVLGRIVGERRLGRALEAFRLGIRARIAVNSSRGLIGHVQALFDLLRSADTATFATLAGSSLISAITDTPPTSAEATQIQGYVQAASAISYRTEIVWVPGVGETEDLVWGEADETPSRMFGLTAP